MTVPAGREHGGGMAVSTLPFGMTLVFIQNEGVTPRSGRARRLARRQEAEHRRDELPLPVRQQRDEVTAAK
jgi:hypothetical protein